MTKKILSPQEVADLLGCSEIERKSTDASIRAQEVADKNETDRVLIEKVVTCADLLDLANLDEIDLGLVRRKLMELVGRL